MRIKKYLIMFFMFSFSFELVSALPPTTEQLRDSFREVFPNVVMEKFDDGTMTKFMAFFKSQTLNFEDASQYVRALTKAFGIAICDGLNNHVKILVNKSELDRFLVPLGYYLRSNIIESFLGLYTSGLVDSNSSHYIVLEGSLTNDGYGYPIDSSTLSTILEEFNQQTASFAPQPYGSATTNTGQLPAKGSSFISRLLKPLDPSGVFTEEEDINLFIEGNISNPNSMLSVKVKPHTTTDLAPFGQQLQISSFTKEVPPLPAKRPSLLTRLLEPYGAFTEEEETSEVHFHPFHPMFGKVQPRTTNDLAPVDQQSQTFSFNPSAPFGQQLQISSFTKEVPPLPAKRPSLLTRLLEPYGAFTEEEETSEVHFSPFHPMFGKVQPLTVADSVPKENIEQKFQNFVNYDIVKSGERLKSFLEYMQITEGPNGKYGLINLNGNFVELNDKFVELSNNFRPDDRCIECGCAFLSVVNGVTPQLRCLHCGHNFNMGYKKARVNESGFVVCPHDLSHTHRFDKLSEKKSRCCFCYKVERFKVAYYLIDFKEEDAKKIDLAFLNRYIVR